MVIYKLVLWMSNVCLLFNSVKTVFEIIEIMPAWVVKIEGDIIQDPWDTLYISHFYKISWPLCLLDVIADISSCVWSPFKIKAASPASMSSSIMCRHVNFYHAGIVCRILKTIFDELKSRNAMPVRSTSL